MSKVKTVVVMLRFKPSATLDWKHVTENATFGMDCHYATANQFIEEVKALHKNHSFQYEILNVVIG